MSDEKLKPCPFCGSSEVELEADGKVFAGQCYPGETGFQQNNQGYRARCVDCACQTCWWHSISDAVKYWNTRAAGVDIMLRDALYKVADLEAQVRAKDEALKKFSSQPDNAPGLMWEQHQRIGIRGPFVKTHKWAWAKIADEALSNTTVKTEADIKCKCYSEIADWLELIGNNQIAESLRYKANELRQRAGLVRMKVV